MTTDPATFRIEVLLCFQRALWDMVTPALRAVAVRLAYSLIEARFIYEAVGERERMIADDVEGYVVADFIPPVNVRFVAVAVPPSAARELESGEEWWRATKKSGSLDSSSPRPHISHLPEWCPDILPYLALPPGWRVLLAPGFEDVWFDETLL